MSTRCRSGSSRFKSRMDCRKKPSTLCSLLSSKGANKRCKYELIQMSSLLPVAESRCNVHLSSLRSSLPPRLYREPSKGEPLLPGLSGGGGALMWNVWVFILINYDWALKIQEAGRPPEEWSTRGEPGGARKLLLPASGTSRNWYPHRTNWSKWFWR